MEQVKELFTDCTDVFEELLAVRKHLCENIQECQTVVENIQACLSRVDTSEPKAEAQIQVKGGTRCGSDMYDTEAQLVDVSFVRTCVKSCKLRRSRPTPC